MTTGEKLKAIAKLDMKDGLRYEDYHDIGVWSDLCGPHYDTTVLSEKSIERIDSIFSKYYGV